MHTLVAITAAPMLDVLRGIREDQLGAPTPCTDYDVRGLIHHLLHWAPSLIGAAHKESVAPREATAVDAKELEACVEEIVAAWSDPDAWEGVTQMGGPMRLPAPMIGGMVLGELVVHAWDLARATGQEPVWSDEALQAVLVATEATAEQGRAMGVYGPRVPVAADAPLLARILGVTGRDPSWSPA